MEEEMTMDYRTELAEARDKVNGLKRDGRVTTLDAFWELCCGDVLLAEENAERQDTEWENAFLAEELLDVAAYLEGYDQMLEKLHAAISRMRKVVCDHPRLTLRLLEFELLLLRRIEAQCDHEVDICEDVMHEMALYRHNIERADEGDFEQIRPVGYLKADPVEWTADYERVIDEAKRKIYGLLDDVPRGMGFCFAYWHIKQKVLYEDFGIRWRSPHLMNPGVHFD